MQIYHYDPRTGAYAGATEADESPLEPGVFLVPAHATDQPPPVAGDGQVVVWRGEGWGVDAAPQPTAPTAEELRARHNAEIDALIKDVEAKQSRAVREGLLALAAIGAELPALAINRLQSIDAEITALRAQRL